MGAILRAHCRRTFIAGIRTSLTMADAIDASVPLLELAHIQPGFDVNIVASEFNSASATAPVVLPRPETSVRAVFTGARSDIRLRFPVGSVCV